MSRSVLLIYEQLLTYQSFQNGEEVWACNAVYAAAHFDFAVVTTDCSVMDN